MYIFLELAVNCTASLAFLADITQPSAHYKKTLKTLVHPRIFHHLIKKEMLSALAYYQLFFPNSSGQRRQKAK